jgi:hypothetical protein
VLGRQRDRFALAIVELLEESQRCARVVFGVRVNLGVNLRVNLSVNVAATTCACAATTRAGGA